MEIVDDVGKGADVQNLLDEPRQDIGFAVQYPEQGRKRDVDTDQDRTQTRNITGQQAKPTVDVGDERLHELIDDVEVVHRKAYCGL